MAHGSVDECPNGHKIQDLVIRCPEEDCDNFVLFLPDVYDTKKTRSLVYGAGIVLATIVAFLLFRLTNEIWPLYLFLMVGVLHLYATIFSRGGALGSAMWFLASVAGVWGVGVLLNQTPSLWPHLGAANRPILLALPVLTWLLVTGYMLWLGSQWTLSAIRTTSTYFLATATFTLGFWGVWIFYNENGLVDNAVYQVAITVGLFLPLLCISFLFLLPGWQNRGSRDWLLNLSAISLFVVAIYLTLVEPLVTALGFLLGRYIPRALGRPPLGDVTTELLGGRQWRALAASVLLLIAAALVVVQGALEASREERDPNSAPSAPGANQNVKAAVNAASFVARFLGETAWEIARNIGRTIRRAIDVTVPVVAFTLLSMLIVIVLSAFNDYLLVGPFHQAVSLWGMSLTILVAVVVLCSVAFDFAPAGATRVSPDTPRLWRRQRFLGISLVVMAAGSLLGGLGYFLVSLASAALLPVLWPRLSPSVQSVTGLFSSDIYVVNLTIALAGFALLAVLFAVGARGILGRTPERLASFFALSAAGVLLLMGGASVFFGIGPLQTSLSYVGASYDPSAATRLMNLMTPSVQAHCTQGRLLVTGQVASEICHGVGSADVSYHLFDSRADLLEWYEGTVQARGIPGSSGNCATDTLAEGAYGGPHPGRLACYIDRRGAWLLWTDSDALVLGIAQRGDARAGDLYASWLAGSFALSSDRTG
jgi:hypothetical protein